MSARHLRLLVLGGDGRLGRSLREHLAAEPGITATFTRRPSLHAGSADALPVLDVTDRDQVHATIGERRPDVILHLASITGAAVDADPALAHAVNVDSVQHVVDAAMSAGRPARVVFMSSSSVYGDGYRTPAAESAPLDPRSAYAQSKVEAEAILAAATGVESVLLRCFNVFGERFDESLVARLQHSSPDAPVTLYGTDDFVRDYIHVAEVMRGLVAAFRVPLPAPSRVFNIGSGRPLSNRELVERLQRRSPVHYVVRSGARSYSCADPSRARAELGLAAGRSPG